MTRLFNHAFTIAFSLEVVDPTGERITAAEFRRAILLQLATLTDDELCECIGAPFDTYEVTDPHRPRDPFTRIAADELGLETLETRGRDSRDFHDLPVSRIAAALRRAYHEGRNSVVL